MLRIYPDRITLARGLLSKCYRDYNPRDIRSIDIDQTFLQRIVGVGDITLATAATAEGTEKMNSIPDPMSGHVEVAKIGQQVLVEQDPQVGKPYSQGACRAVPCQSHRRHRLSAGARTIYASKCRYSNVWGPQEWETGGLCLLREEGKAVPAPA